MTNEERETRAILMRVRLAAQIKFWQLRYNMDTPTLAVKTDLSENTLYRLKRGDNGATLNTITQIADGFGLPPAVLLMPLEVDNGSDDE